MHAHAPVQSQPATPPQLLILQPAVASAVDLDTSVGLQSLWAFAMDDRIHVVPHLVRSPDEWGCPCVVRAEPRGFDELAPLIDGAPTGSLILDAELELHAQWRNKARARIYVLEEEGPRLVAVRRAKGHERNLMRWAMGVLDTLDQLTGNEPRRLAWKDMLDAPDADTAFLSLSMLGLAVRITLDAEADALRLPWLPEPTFRACDAPLPNTLRRLVG